MVDEPEEMDEIIRAESGHDEGEHDDILERVEGELIRMAGQHSLEMVEADDDDE